MEARQNKANQKLPLNQVEGDEMEWSHCSDKLKFEGDVSCSQGQLAAFISVLVSRSSGRINSRIPWILDACRLLFSPMPFVRRIRFRIPIPIRIRIQILSGLVWPFDVSSVDRWRSFQLNANLNEGFFLLHTFFFVSAAVLLLLFPGVCGIVSKVGKCFSRVAAFCFPASQAAFLLLPLSSELYFFFGFHIIFMRGVRNKFASFSWSKVLLSFKTTIGVGFFRWNVKWNFQWC